MWLLFIVANIQQTESSFMPSMRQKTFFPHTLSLWNKLDLETRKSPSLSGITPKPDKFEYFCHSCDRRAGIHHARLRIGCSKLKSHLHNNLHVIEEESCQCGHRSEDPFHFFFECPRYVALRNNLFMSVAQHTDCSLQTLLFGDPKLNHKQNCDIFDAVQHLLPYQNALTDPFMRCPSALPNALYPSTFNRSFPPSLATKQASRAHDKRDLYNICIVSQLSRNKYCLNQVGKSVVALLPCSIHFQCVMK